MSMPFALVPNPSAADGQPVSTSAGAPLTGTGAPNGVQAASPGAQYWDSTGRTMYVKVTGTGTTGWEILVGI